MWPKPMHFSTFLKYPPVDRGCILMSNTQSQGGLHQHHHRHLKAPMVMSILQNIVDGEEFGIKFCHFNLVNIDRGLTRSISWTTSWLIEKVPLSSKILRICKVSSGVLVPAMLAVDRFHVRICRFNPSVIDRVGWEPNFEATLKNRGWCCCT